MANIFFEKYKMNAIVNTLILERDRFMPEMHLKQPGFKYSACGPFTKNREIIKKIKETGYSRYIYQNKLDKACLQHDMAYEYFKDLTDIQLISKCNPKTAGGEGGGVNLFYPLCGFSENVSSKEKVKPCFFVTFNIIISYIFPENFIEIPQVGQKI